MRRVVREMVEDDAAEGSWRLEFQVDPTSYAPFVGGITPALEIVLDEAKIAARQWGCRWELWWRHRGCDIRWRLGRWLVLRPGMPVMGMAR